MTRKLNHSFTTLSQCAALFALAAIVGVCSSALAATKVWSATPANYQWDATSANWTGGTGIFANGDSVQFTDSGSASSPVVLMGALSPASVTVNVLTNHYTFSGSGALSGPNSLVKSGAGTLTLSNSAANTYTGGTLVNGGTLEVAATNGFRLGQGSITIASNATLFMNTGMATWSNNVSGSGLWKVGTGTGSQSTVLVGDYSAFNGTIEVATGSGKIVLATPAKYPAAGATLKIDANTTAYLSGGGTFGSVIQLYGGVTGEALGQLRLGGVAGITGSGDITLFGNTTIGVNSGQTGIISGKIGGNFGFTKLSAGTLILSGENTYTGNTTINAGTLRLATAGLPPGLQIMPLGDSITYGTGGNNAGYRGPLYNLLAPIATSFYYVGTTNFNPGSLPTSSINETYHEGHSSYAISDVYSNLDGFNNSCFLKYGGPERDPNGGYWLTGGSDTGRIPIYPDVILLLVGANDLSNLTGASNRLDDLMIKFTSLRPATRLIVAKITPSTSHANVDSYNMIVMNVVAKYQSPNSLISLVDLNTDFPSNGLSGDGLHPNATGYNWMAGQWYNAILAAYSEVSAAIPATSPTTVAMGATLDLNGTQVTVGPLAGAGNVTLGGVGSAVFTINNTLTNDSTFSGVISGMGNIVKIGPAILTLSGKNNYSGTTIISAGTLQVNGTLASGGVTVASGATLSGTGTINGAVTVQSGGTLSPGPSLGTLTINSSLTLAGNLLVELNKTASPSNNLTVVSGTLINSGVGTVTVTNLGLTMLVAGDRFQLFNQPLLNGQALAITPLPGNGLTWTNNLAVDGSIGVVPITTPPVKATNLVIVATGSGSFRVSGMGGANQAYGLYASTNVALPMTNWWLLGMTNANGNGGIQFLDVQATNDQRFYRVGHL